MATQVGEIYYNATIETGDAIKGQRALTSQVNKTESAMLSLSKVATGLAAALATNKIIEYADAWATVNNKLANVVKTGESQIDVSERVFNVAQRTRISLDATATLYQRLETSTRKYVTSGYDAGRITETINKAFIVGGATSAEMSGAIVQLGQALGAGALRGEEFNSVNEAAPKLMQAFADELGVGREKMRDLAAQGAITTDVMIKALKALESPIDEQFSKMTATFAQNTQVATNNLTKFVGESTVVKNTVAAMGNAFIVASEHIDELLIAVGALAGVMAGKGLQAATAHTQAIIKQMAANQAALIVEREKAAAALAGALAMQKSTAATLAHAEATYAAYASEKALASLIAARSAAAAATNAVATAQRGLATATAAASIAMRGLGAVMGALGGPVGIILLVVSAIAMYMSNSDKAKTSTTEFASEVDRLSGSFRELNKVQAEAELAKNAQGQRALKDEIEAQRKAVLALAEAKSKADKYTNEANAFKGSGAAKWQAEALDRQKKAAEALAIATGVLDTKQQQLNKAVELETNLRKQASGVQDKSKPDESAFLLRYDKEKAAIAEIEATRKRSLDEIAKQEGVSEQVKAAARIAVNKEADEKIQALHKKSLSAAEKFDFDAYYAGLAGSHGDAMAKLSAQEDKALNDAKTKYTEGKISFEEFQAAKTRIQASYAIERENLEADLVKKEQERAAKSLDEFLKGIEKKRQIQAETEKATAQMNLAAVGEQSSPEDKLAAELELMRVENEAKLAVQQEYLDKKQITQEQYDAYALAQTAAQKQKEKELEQNAMQAKLSIYNMTTAKTSEMFADAATLLANSGKKNTATYRAMFAASKAFAIANAVINTAQGVSKALATLPPPLSFATAAATGVAGALQIQTIRGQSMGGGRLYGGTTSANTTYKVNESGKPEMWTASNGSQYMMTGSQSGRVTPADSIGGGGVQVVINNYAGAQIEATPSQDGRIVEIAVRQAVATVAGQILDNSGQVWSAMRSSTTVSGRTA